MPVQESDVVSRAASVTVELDVVHSGFHSLLLLAKSKHHGGLGEWIPRTLDELTPEKRRRHALVMIGLHHAVTPEQSWPSFLDYVGHLAALDPVVLRDRMLAAYARVSLLVDGEYPEECAEPQPVDFTEVLRSVESYLDFLRARFKPESMDEALETEAYAYVIDPPAMQELVVSHLREMWETFLEPEWQRVAPMLRGAVEAFQQVDLGGMDKLEAARLVTGRELEAKWAKLIEKAEQVIFVPSAHVGPYLGRFVEGDTLWIVFGAHLAEGAHARASALGRAEIVVRLSALADDSRLRILKLVADRGELSSQELIEILDLSQSTVSRHLKQLAASGYLSERRCNGAKCYAIRTEGVEETLQAVAVFLIGKRIGDGQ